MVVALGARHVRAEERGHEVRDAVERHLGVEQHEAGRAVVAQAAVGGDHLEDHLVPRGVRREARLEPVFEGERGDTLPERVFHAQEVRHPVEHLHGITRREDEVIDELGALIRRRAGEEGVGFLGGRNPTDGVQVDAAQERFVAGRGVQGLLVRGQHRGDETVDVGGGRGDDLPAEAVRAAAVEALLGEDDVLGHEDVRLEMIGAAVAGLDGDELAGETTELGVDLAAVLVRPSMPDSRPFGDGGDRPGRHGGRLDDRLGGFLGGLLIGGLRDGTPGETTDQDQTRKESHKGVLQMKPHGSLGGFI